MSGTQNDRLHRRISEKIREIEARKTPQLVHFLPHYPRYHDGALRIDCWCGAQFKAFQLDAQEFPRMISWINEHAPHEPKETP